MDVKGNELIEALLELDVKELDEEMEAKSEGS